MQRANAQRVGLVPSTLTELVVRTSQKEAVKIVERAQPVNIAMVVEPCLLDSAKYGNYPFPSPCDLIVL
jgi:hypothetical protein